MSVRYMETERIAMLAYEESDYFLRGIDLGQFVARLHETNPQSENPREDAIIGAADAAVFYSLNDRYLETPDQIDALLQGSIAGAEVHFDKPRSIET